MGTGYGDAPNCKYDVSPCTNCSCVGSPLELSQVKSPAMNPMATAPKDGAEILAFHIDGGNFHPVFWVSPAGDSVGAWRMRWNTEYYCTDNFYDGWIPYPSI